MSNARIYFAVILTLKKFILVIRTGANLQKEYKVIKCKYVFLYKSFRSVASHAYWNSVTCNINIELHEL